jgi:Mg-chelatase subunit ChlD
MRENANQQIVAGSLGAVARKNDTTIAMGFMNVKAFVMVDVSGSMTQGDAGSGRSRYDAACEQLEQLQNAYPGEIAVAAFSNRADFCPSGVPIMQGGMTDMVAALRMMLMANNTDIRLVLISDGEPDNDKETLSAASKFKSKIDTIFVGNETGPGRQFLKDLAAATGGIAVVNKVSELGHLKDNITRLITA